MKRFVDLGHQLGLDDDWPREFAWYCTVVDSFEVHGPSQTWESWEDFERDYDGIELDRYKTLCPKWVFNVKDQQRCHWRSGNGTLCNFRRSSHSSFAHEFQEES